MSGNGTLPTRNTRFECPEGYGRDCRNPLCRMKYAQQESRDNFDRTIAAFTRMADDNNVDELARRAG